LKVQPLSSLGAKLFYLTTSLVLVTIAISSWQSSQLFKHFMQRQIEETVLLQAKEAATNVGTAVNGLMSQLAVTIHTVKGLPAREQKRILAAFLSSNREFVAMQLIATKRRAAAAPTLVVSPEVAVGRLGRKDLREVARALAALGPELVRGLEGGRPGSQLLANLAPRMDLPLLAAGLPFTFTGGQTVWAVLYVWQSRLSDLLPSNGQLASAVVADDGRLISSSSAGRIVSGKLGSAKGLVALARQSQSPVGLRPLKGPHGEDWIGAYAHVQGTHHLVLVRRDPRALYQATTMIVRRTLIWAWIFILFAMLGSFVGATRLTRNLRALTEVTRRIAAGDFSVSLPPQPHDEVGILGASVRNMAAQILTLLQTAVAAARQEKELEMAKVVQEMLFPPEEIHGRQLAISGYCHGASECGGDWWGHYELKDGRHLILIADATGHGAGAALVTALVHAAAKAAVATMDDADSVSSTPVSEVLASMSRLLWSTGKGRTTMTALGILLDPLSGRLSVASAGHNRPFHVRSTSDVAAEGSAKASPASRRPATIKCQGTPLGIEARATYVEQEVVVGLGEKVILYTDGLIEGQNVDLVAWGKRNLEKIIMSHLTLGAKALREKIIAAAFAHFGDHPLNDDVTLVIVERVAAADSAAVSEQRQSA